MAFFNFGKKKDVNESVENLEKNLESELTAENERLGKSTLGLEIQSVKVLGSGCTKCNLLEAAAKEALKELGHEVKVEHVSDFAEIATYEVMSTPALVVNEKLISYGKVLKASEIVAKLRAL